MKFLFPLLLFLSLNGFGQTSAPAILKTIVSYEQKMADAIAIGDISVFEKYLHDSCFITTEDGSMLTKKELIADIRPLPAGYVGKIVIIEPRLKLYANTAIISFIDDEYLELFSQKIHTRYKHTDTWMKMNDQWKKISMQLFEIPKNPAPLKVDDSILKKYEGTYELGPEKKCTVYAENGRLYVKKGSRDAQELLAETENFFFRKGDARVNIIFMKNQSDSLYSMTERREGEDLIWKQTK